MVVKSLEIKPILYPGSVSNFRAWMDRFISRSAGIMLIPPSKPFNEIIKMIRMDNDSDIIDFTRFNRQLIIQYSEADKSSTREVWYATFYDPLLEKNIKQLNKWGTILAVEQYPNKTLVEFMDGIYFRLKTNSGVIEFARGEMIGEFFSSLAPFMENEIKKDFSNMKQANKDYENHQVNSSRVIINGNVSGSNIVVGNENNVSNLPKEDGTQ